MPTDHPAALRPEEPSPALTPLTKASLRPAGAPGWEGASQPLGTALPLLTTPAGWVVCLMPADASEQF